MVVAARLVFWTLSVVVYPLYPPKTTGTVADDCVAAETEKEPLEARPCDAATTSPGIWAMEPALFVWFTTAVIAWADWMTAEPSKPNGRFVSWLTSNIALWPGPA